MAESREIIGGCIIEVKLFFGDLEELKNQGYKRQTRLTGCQAGRGSGI